MNNFNSIQIVLACDTGYIAQLATALRSITEVNRANWPISVCILSNGVSDKNRSKLINSLPKGSVSIRWVSVKLNQFSEFGTLPHISTTAYARLLIPQIFPDTVKRVLYLDSDILVLKSLAPLFASDLQGAVVGAVQESFDDGLSIDSTRQSGIPVVQRYFNSGVLLMDLDRWRAKQISERAIEYLKNHPSTRYGDQDALNFACDGLWKPLDTTWNFQGHRKTRIQDIDEAERPSIIHFVSSQKPWKASALSLNASFYDSYRSRTKFSRSLPERVFDGIQQTGTRIITSIKRSGFAKIIRSTFGHRRLSGSC